MSSRWSWAHGLRGWHCWSTFEARAIWKSPQRVHEVSFGYHYDRYHIENQTFAASTWKNEASIGATPTSSFEGDTRTDALNVQDAWEFNRRWTLTDCGCPPGTLAGA